ncbi:MAG TPA: hypothetical protein PLJ60_20035, partial [Chryseolinea sp.]|nr:hypothetical protein [Chryseolinea sp.]
MGHFYKFNTYFFTSVGFIFLFAISSITSLAQVTFSGGVAPTMCVGDPSYVAISNIVISENANADFTNIDGVNRTFRLSPTAASRYEFEPGFGSVVFAGTGSGSVTESINVTSTLITVTISESDNVNESGLNTITISGLRVRAITTSSSLLLERAAMGTITLNGFVTGTDIPSSSLVSNNPPSTSNAGSNQTGASAVCGSTTTLNASAPAVGTGQWSFVTTDGLGVINNINNRLSQFDGSFGFTYVLRWSVTNGVCTPSTSDVSIHFDQNPSISEAGPIQNICGSTSTSLNADAPTVGTGQWSFISNPDGLGAIGNVNNRNSAFSGASGSNEVGILSITFCEALAAKPSIT